MTYDLALNRVDHDMVFTLASSGVAPTPHAAPGVPKYQLWFIDNADKIAQQIKKSICYRSWANGSWT